TDNCGTVTVTNDATLPISTQGTTVFTWTYNDGNGNTSTQTQNVVIADISAPVADVATLADVTAECEVTSLTAPTATDNCGTVTVTNDATLPISTQGTTVVTWTYNDGNGNTSTQTQNVVIADISAPVADVATLADVTAECEVTSLTAPTATDNCGTVTVTNDATLPISAQGTTVVTWTYNDGNGNTSTQTQNVVIADISAPVADVATLADVTAECEVVSLTAPTATDNCGTVTVTNDATLPISTSGTTVVTWTYNDGNGNTSTQTQNVVISDISAPVADVATLADVTAECEVVSLTAPTATDNCGTVTVTNDATLPISTQGTTVVTWTYDDGHGNTSTQTQNVVIADAIVPTITCPNDTVVCEPIVSYTAPVGSDNCTVVSTLQTLGLGSGSTFPIGVTTEEYTVTDIAGNTASCSFTITLNEAPIVNLGIDTTICEGDTVILDAGVFDSYLWSNGETSQTILVDSAGLGIGTHAFIVTAIDNNGCEAIDTVFVTIEICSGVENNLSLNTIQVYPNPSHGLYTISADGNFNYLIMDITGKQISAGKLEDKTSQIDISNHAPGIYLIRFVNEEFSKTIKLIKE
ncbi:MAG: HYR domain-containing protein, partial [Bacteroidales bacterium]|nr:HYR domain-containing protein [Bacteroidales bacterium]